MRPLPARIRMCGNDGRTEVGGFCNAALGSVAEDLSAVASIFGLCTFLSFFGLMGHHLPLSRMA